jgi:signal transduction histidine kinase/DNA-binding response OmpR family regulator/CHASE3 domain sensor protein
MQGNFKRNLLISSAVSIAILLISSTASYISIKSLLDSSSWVNHTQDVIYNLNRGVTVLTEAQTSMRGYLVTGKDDFLDQYQNAEGRANAYFEKVEELTVDNPLQQNSLRELKPMRREFFNYLQRRIDAKKNGQEVSANDLYSGRNQMANIRKVMSIMEEREKTLLAERTTESGKYASYSLFLIIAAALIALLISLVFFARILNDYKERMKLHVELEKQEKDTAGRIKAISKIAGEIAEGNYKIRVSDNESDALGNVAGSLNNMAQSLDKSFNLLSEKEWLQAGIAKLNDVMIGEKTTGELANDVVLFIASYTNSKAGIFYSFDNDILYAVAGYSYDPEGKRRQIKSGEGLTGQAFASAEVMEMRFTPPEDYTISFALGDVKPMHVIAIPLIDNMVTGVVEMASLREYTDSEMQFFHTIGNNIGIALKAAQNRERIQELLEETQAQSEELRVQHTELESMNAELETQTEKLQASEEELRVQQEELQQTNEELAERSTLLEERNMEIQKKSEDLELSTRYKSEFLANMSHELRTPLNSILLLSRLLSENNENNLTQEQTEFARVIQSSGNGLLGLIDEILDLSKIEAGKMDLEFLEVPVSEISDSLKALFTEVAKDKNIAFEVTTDNIPLVIKTDKTRLEQILKNLISNAIKFTADGSVTLRITSHETDPKLVDFIVKDTGIGIAPEKQPLIFEAFQQADGSTKRKYGGTGLGLSISRELAKLLNGQITLKSSVGKGSTFTLTVPVSGTATLPKQEIPAIEIPQASRPIDPYISSIIPEDVPDDREQLNPGDKIILIVEDDINFAKSLLEFTRRRGYKGIVSVRGDHALNLAMVFKPVGILLDIQLPVKSGWEVMEELKNNPQTKPIPVHIMSSHKLRQESLLKGAVNFLDKPVAFEQMPDIFKRIEHIINRESQKVLIIEDNPKHAKALAFFLETYNINSEIKSEVADGVDALQKADVNCVILDMGIPDRQSYDILENVKKNPGLENLPVIVFTGRSLSMKEELKIKKYADSIVVKTAYSYQRMLDEVSLFLHIVEENKNGKKPNLVNNVLSDKTVLVVDDDVRNIYSLTKALESLKMNVITAIDGKEALKALADHPKTDVVLLDMMMPNMDGYETAERIRKNPKFKNLPVIAVTAKAMTGDREKCINAGASDYITKPVDVDQLLSLLRVWLYDKK